MIVKFNKTGKGCGAGPVEYLLGRNYDREDATVLRGNPDQTIDLIDSLKSSNKYTSGFLSLTETDLSNEKKKELMNDFEKVLFPGMSKDQYSVLWVEHLDKNNLELNFVIPRVELTTGKHLTAYYEKSDFPRVNAWKDIKNIENDFTDPNDPARARAVSYVSKHMPKSAQEIKRQLNDAVLNLVADGTIKNRADIIDVLQQGGFEIARTTKKSISIKNPEGTRNIRLKGAIYAQSFKPSINLESEVREASRAYRARSSERLQQARSILQEGIDIKSQANAKKHPRLRVEHKQNVVQKHEQERAVVRSRDVVRLNPSDRVSANAESSGGDLNGADRDRKNAARSIEQIVSRAQQASTQLGARSGRIARNVRAVTERKSPVGRASNELAGAVESTGAAIADAETTFATVEQYLRHIEAMNRGPSLGM